MAPRTAGQLVLLWTLTGLAAASGEPTRESSSAVGGTRAAVQEAGRIAPVGPRDSADAGDYCALAARPVAPNRALRPSVPKSERQTAASVASVASVRSSVAGGGPCTSAEFAALGGSALVEALATSSLACLGSLWSFDADVAMVIAGPNVVLIADAMTADAANLATNATRLERLALVYQIAFYHAFYQSTVAYDAATVQAARQAALAVSASPAFFDDAAAVKNLRQQWTVTIDSLDATHLAVETVRLILERYRTTPLLQQVHQERVTAYNCLFSLSRQIANHQPSGAQSPWYGLLDAAFVETVAGIALDLGHASAAEYVVLNAIYVLGHFSYLDPPIVALAHQRLSDAYATFPQYGAPWLRAVIDLETFFDAELAGGTVLDVEQIRQDVEAIALPDTFVLDQGRMVFRTAETLPTIHALYDALKEVLSQFFRKTTLLRPTPGDTNEVVTLVIYASPADYALYQPFLFGLPTNNGGIYIEQDGRLYTYQRTPQQSIFTLEELLRHEFVHYLDGRYVIVPSFGDPGSLYDASRLVWYNEGLAEYLVGSTRVRGVLPRKALLQQIEDDPVRMTVAGILGATYGSGFGFYPYAGMLLEFLAAERPGLLVELFERIRADDAAAVDAFYAALAADGLLQQAYDAYLTLQIARMNSGEGPFAEDVPTTPTPSVLPQDNATAILAALGAEVPAPAGHINAWSERYRYTGTIDLPVAGDPADLPVLVRAALALEFDNALRALTPMGNNFRSAVAWFGDVEIAGDVAWATYAIEGPYAATAAAGVAPAAPTFLVATAGSRAIVLDWADSPESDLAGYRVFRATDTGGPYGQVSSVPVLESQFADLDLGAAAGTTYFYRVSAVDASGNESAWSSPAEASAPTRVLLVNGYTYSGNPYVNAYAGALDAIGVPYDLWDRVTQGEVPPSVLSSYTESVVLWEAGYFISADQLSSSERAAILAYLDGGGNFVFSGAYTALALDDTPLFTNYLHCSLVGFNINLPGLDGVAGSVLGDGLHLTMGYLGYESEVDFAPPAVPSFVYDATSGPGGIDSSGTAILTVDDGYRAVYLAFPFADLASASRLALLGRIMGSMLPATTASPTAKFLADQTTLGWTPISSAQSYSVYRGTFSGLADLDLDGLPDAGYGECREFADASADTIFDTFYPEPQWPLEGGAGFFYLVGYDAGGEPSGIGSTSAGLPRVPAAPCP